jgi:LacI family transcriptional regulator
MCAAARSRSSSMVTLREVAQECGLSTAAVSFALRNSPKVTLETRQRVQACAKRLGYRQHPDLQKLMARLREVRRVRRHAKIAVVSPEFSRAELQGDRIILEEVSGVRKRCEELGYGVELFTLAELHGSSKRLRTILQTRNIEGCILTPLGEAHGAGTVSFEFTDIAAVALGYSIRKPRLNRVCPHHMQIMKDACSALVRMGYQRIGLSLNHRYDDGSHNLLAAAFLYVQQQMPARRRLPIFYDEQIDDVETRRWLRQHKPDVVIGLPRLYDVMLRSGVRVPEDIAFCCLDVTRDPRPFAGLDHRYAQIGIAAADMVIEHIVRNEKGLPSEPRVVLVDSAWRGGETVCGNALSSDGNGAQAFV